MGTLHLVDNNFDLTWHFPIIRRRTTERSKYEGYVCLDETIKLSHPHVVYFHYDVIGPPHSSTERQRQLKKDIRRFVSANVEYEVYYRPIDLCFRWWWKKEITPDHFSARHGDWVNVRHGYWAFYFEDLSTATAFKLRFQEDTADYELVPSEYRDYIVDHKWWEKGWNPDDPLQPLV